MGQTLIHKGTWLLPMVVSYREMDLPIIRILHLSIIDVTWDQFVPFHD